MTSRPVARIPIMTRGHPKNLNLSLHLTATTASSVSGRAPAGREQWSGRPGRRIPQPARRSGAPAVAGRPALPWPGAGRERGQQRVPRPLEAGEGHFMAAEREQRGRCPVKAARQVGAAGRATAPGGLLERASRACGCPGLFSCSPPDPGTVQGAGGLLRPLPFWKNKGTKPVCKSLQQAVLHSAETDTRVGEGRVEGDLGNQGNLTCVSRGQLRVPPGRKQCLRTGGKIIHGTKFKDTR